MTKPLKQLAYGETKQNILIIKSILAKTNDKNVRRFGDILAPLSSETKLNMRSQEKLRVQSH